MIRIGISSFFLFISSVMLGQAVFAQSGRVAPKPTPDDTVRVRTEEIKLNVIALDEDGKFVRDVGTDDLVISENNILHQPASVRRLAANVLIVMDTGGELRWMKSLDQTRKAANALIASLRPEDSVAVLQYSDKAEILLEWTTDKEEAFAAVNRSKFGRRSVFVKALKLSREFLDRSSVDNKHMVLITDGTDSSASHSAKYRAMRGLLSSDISVHILSYTKLESNDIEPRTKAVSKTPPPKAMPDEVVAGLPNGVRQTAQAPKIGPTINLDRKLLETMRARKADLDTSEEQLTELAENTNGIIILPESKEEMIEKSGLIARSIDSSYVVTYVPKIPVEEVGGERYIVVSSKRPGLIADARRKLLVESGRQ